MKISTLLEVAQSVSEDENSSQSARELAKFILSSLPTVEAQKQEDNILFLRIAVSSLLLYLAQDSQVMIEGICDKVRQELQKVIDTTHLHDLEKKS